ncbi:MULTISPECIES: hypothetical protein [unclassified Brevundimonas]|uniref:hypothetical protein n=1 Tax=unclassified Brevundimonas TaxID=2622653 RepID=UPI0025BA5359|nr:MULTISPECIES: hypothetical protein [unclassified Brevundimonas]
MFEFGRDLRRLFEKARDSQDLGWLELVGLSLVESEARSQSTDAGRVSCAHPYEGWMRAAALWREHARRSGSSESLQRAEQAGRDALRAALNEDQAIRARIDIGHTSMLAFDLFGVPRRLDSLLDSVIQLPLPRRAETQAEIDSLKARLEARLARIANDAERMAQAAERLSEAMLGLKPTDTLIGEDLSLDRAALSLEAGIQTRNARLLDQAGRELRDLVESASPDERPVSRARALALCGTGMAALASVANDPSARQQAGALFDAAADQFTPDHSPLDWATIQLLKAERSEGDPEALEQAQKLTDKPGLIIGALIRERSLAYTLRRAEAEGDMTSLAKVELLLRHRLARPMDETTAVDWASDQISMARLAMTMSTRVHYPLQDLGMALYEASDAASLAGAPSLAVRAKDLMLAAKTR